MRWLKLAGNGQMLYTLLYLEYTRLSNLAPAQVVFFLAGEGVTQRHHQVVSTNQRLREFHCRCRKASWDYLQTVVR